MQYVLVENKEYVILGPSEWRKGFFQSELDDLGVSYDLSKSAPTEKLTISDNLEIYPVHSIIEPGYNPLYEHLGGPFWAFETGQAKGWYNVREHSIETVRRNLKGLAAAERYRKEISGTTTDVADALIKLDTNRESRALLAQKLLGMPEYTAIDWKHDGGWVQLTKTHIQTLITAIDAHIQSAFAWEKNISDKIDAATTLWQLKSIQIVEVIDPYTREI